MLRQPKGYLYRRAHGQHINVHDRRHTDAHIYFCIQQDGRRGAYSLFTAHRQEAERRVMDTSGRIQLSVYKKTFILLVGQGKRAVLV